MPNRFASDKRQRKSRKASRSAYTLIEMLMVVAIIAIVASVVIPNFEPNVHDQLHSAARIIAADLTFARDLAAANGSRYELRFDANLNLYALKHTGTNSALNVLPTGPSFSDLDTPTLRVTELSELPIGSTAPSIVTIQKLSQIKLAGLPVQSVIANSAVETVEFEELGGTTDQKTTSVWLASGTGQSRRYLSVSVAPATGIVSIGEMQIAPPPSATSPSGGGGSSPPTP